MPLSFSGLGMIRFDICGIGVWSEYFADCESLFVGLAACEWAKVPALQPKLIPPRERRRAPKFVKMAVEVMLQACQMAGMEAGRPATVFASQMSDMETTDYICRVLAQSPELMSPTKFHNSVHNAAVGYWSIATENSSPANAIAAFELSVPMALLEAAAQLHAEQIPVLVVAQDSAPPQAFDYICPGAESLAAAMLLAPTGSNASVLAECDLRTVGRPCEWPQLPPGLPGGLAANASAKILPVIEAVMGASTDEARLTFPLARDLSLELDIRPEEIR
jgi:hypothetical protein